jgi:hypothetical protein
LDESIAYVTNLKYEDGRDKTGMQYDSVMAIRAICPQLCDKKSGLKVGRWYDKIGRHKADIFSNEINLIHKPLETLNYEKTIFDLHISLGAREGKRGENAGMCGLTWDKFKENFTRIDLYESKAKRGITWRDCPVDLLFDDLPTRLRALWIERGKPTTEPILKGGYSELTKIYKAIRKALSDYYDGKVEPGLLREFSTIRPHLADKIHVNLLWEAGVPLEVVAGEYLGRGEGSGLMGRGWLTIDIIKKYYLSLTRRSERFQKIRQQVHEYSQKFHANTPEILVEPPETLKESST